MDGAFRFQPSGLSKCGPTVLLLCNADVYACVCTCLRVHILYKKRPESI